MPPRRRRPIKATGPVVKANVLMGWCLEHGPHTTCWKETEFNVCSCKCHKREETK